MKKPNIVNREEEEERREREEAMNEFIEVKYLMTVRTVMKLEEVQKTINEDDQGLFDFLLFCVDDFTKRNQTNISQSEPVNETIDVGDLEPKELGTYTSGKGELKDEDILEDLYQEDKNSGRRE